MRGVVCDLLAALDRMGVAYAARQPGPADRGGPLPDLDVRIHAEDAEALHRVLLDRGFRPMRDLPGPGGAAGTEHHLGLDPATGALVRVRVVSAGDARGGARGRVRARAARIPDPTGMVVAFVGSEASGKSTLLADTAQWLGGSFRVRRIHAGKPPPTALSVAPNLLVPVLRRLFPRQRSTRIDLQYADERAGARTLTDLSPMFAVRSVLLAHDRHRLLKRARRSADAGWIVLADRYPSAELGAPDSRQLPYPEIPGRRSVRTWLAAVEARLYADIPPADLVIHLTAPLGVVLERNRRREKTEPEELVRLRHRQTRSLRFAGSTTCVVDTTRPVAESFRAVHGLVWEALTAPAGPSPGVRPLRPLVDDPCPGPHLAST